MLYISNEEITELLHQDLHGTVDTMEEMFATMETGDFALGGGGYSHGMRMHYPMEGEDNLFIAMPGYLGAPFDVTGVKWHGPNRRCEGAATDSHFLMILNDYKTGIPKACMPVGLTTLYRTAAMSILAASHLANPDAETMGIIGPGKINTLVAEGLLAKFPGISRVVVKGRGSDSTKKFVSAMESLNSNITIEVVSSFEDAVRCADIVSINTGFEFAGIADMPIIRDGWIKPGAVFLCSAFVKFSDRLIIEKAINVCDLYDMYASYEQELGVPVYKHLSNLGNRYVDLIRDGKLNRETVLDMKEIVTGKVAARKSKEDIILFSSGGFATQDLAVCEKLYRKAMKEGVGTELPY